MSFKGQVVKGVLLDISGVLAECSSEGDGKAIEGSVEAVKRLNERGISVRFVTNETQRTRKSLVDRLHRLGFEMPEAEVFPPALAMTKIALSKGLRPFFLVHPNCLPDLEPVVIKDDSEPNCVVLGDAAEQFSYANLNKAFRLLMKPVGGGSDDDSSKCLLFSLGMGRYYREDQHLTIDVGAFAKALEFAAGTEAVVCGKPSSDFFHTALADMGVGADEAVMVGDDIASDVGGAQRAGLRGVLVRTGKYTGSDENHPTVKPDAIVNNLAAIVDMILA